MDNTEKEQWEAEHEPEGIADFPDNEELVITRVDRLKSREARYRITFGTYSLTVLEDVMIKYRMTKGNTFVKRDLEKSLWRTSASASMCSHCDILNISSGPGENWPRSFNKNSLR